MLNTRFQILLSYCSFLVTHKTKHKFYSCLHLIQYWVKNNNANLTIENLTLKIDPYVMNFFMYPKGASRSMCYNSRNQKFCILKSRLLTCPTFFRKNFFVCPGRKLTFFLRGFTRSYKDAEKFRFLTWQT